VNNLFLLINLIKFKINKKDNLLTHKNLLKMAYEIEYLGGHPLWGNPKKANLTVNKSSGYLILEGRGFLESGTKISIDKKDIHGVSFEKGGSRSVGKTLAGAVIGGALTGGIGLLVGGALGAKKKNLSELYVTFVYNQRELVMVLKTGKNTDKIYSEVNSLFA
jgi:hypothetical protein